MKRNALAAVALLGLVTLAGTGSSLLLAYLRNEPPKFQPSSEDVGAVDAFPRGSVTPLRLPGSFVDPDPPATIISNATGHVVGVTQVPSALTSPVLVFLVHDAPGSFTAFYRRGPNYGCRIEWDDEVQQFLDPCQGTTYQRNGDCLQGPCQRSLDRFAVTVSPNGRVLVSISALYVGSTGDE